MEPMIVTIYPLIRMAQREAEAGKTFAIAALIAKDPKDRAFYRSQAKASIDNSEALTEAACKIAGIDFAQVRADVKAMPTPQQTTANLCDCPTACACVAPF